MKVDHGGSLIICRSVARPLDPLDDQSEELDDQSEESVIGL